MQKGSLSSWHLDGWLDLYVPIQTVSLFDASSCLMLHHLIVASDILFKLLPPCCGCKYILHLHPWLLFFHSFHGQIFSFLSRSKQSGWVHEFTLETIPLLGNVVPKGSRTWLGRIMQFMGCTPLCIVKICTEIVAYFPAYLSLVQKTINIKIITSSKFLEKRLIKI